MYHHPNFPDPEREQTKPDRRGFPILPPGLFMLAVSLLWIWLM